MSRLTRLGVVLSGTGRTLENLVACIRAGTLPARIACVISDRPGVRGLDIARDADLPHYLEPDSARTFEILREHEVDLVCLCGYLRHFRVEEPFEGRIMNIHPALLPEFGGQDMHGQVVHQAVLDSGGRFSGCTVHFVDEEYDHGPIILQRTCPVLPDDDHESLAARVFALECQAYPEAIRLFAARRLSVNDDRVHILPV